MSERRIVGITPQDEIARLHEALRETNQLLIRASINNVVGNLARDVTRCLERNEVLLATTLARMKVRSSLS